MRVQNGAVEDPFRSSPSDAAQNSGSESRVNTSSPTGGSSDLVQLSNASSLVSLAKGTMPADKQAKFEAVGAQFRSGQYQTDIPGTSHAIVQGHIQN